MEKITRKNLYANYTALAGRIKELENKKYDYTAGNAYISGIGKVSTLEDTEACVLALTRVLSFEDYVKKSVDFLGDSSLASTFKLDGCLLDDIKTAIKTRYEELIDNDTLKKLRKAAGILERNLNDDDRFTLEMEKIEDLLK